MKRNRITMLAAAAGLIIVALLAAVLFTPSDDDTQESTTQDQEKIEKVSKSDVTPIPENPLGYKSDKIDPVEVEPEPEVKDTPVVKDTPEPKETTPKPKGGIIDYKIKSGDMISKIAAKFDCKTSDIYRINDGLDAKTATKIRPGMVIKVPVGKEGAKAVADAGSESKSPSESYIAEKTVTAEPRDTAFSLAIEYYGKRHLYQKIVDANPDLPWGDGLKGGEKVVIPAHGKSPVASAKPTKKEPTKGATVSRDSLIPERK